MNKNCCGLVTRILLLLSLCAAAELYAYVGTFQIGDEPIDARSSAMGSAGTAQSGKGFCFYNPASPAFAPAPFVGAEFGQIPGDLSRSLVETAWMFPRFFAGISMRIHATDFGVTSAQTEGPDNVPLSSNQLLQAAVTGGYTFNNNRLAAGLSASFYQERLGDRVYRASTLSPGIVYRLIPGTVTLGAAALNYIRLDTLLTPWYKTPRAWIKGARDLPRQVRAGGAWTDTLQSAGMPFTVACDLTYSDMYDRIMVPLGAEIRLTPYLAARVGGRLNHHSDKVHFGAGVMWNNIVVDFDYGITRPVNIAGVEIEPKWLLGLTYSLKSSHRPTAAAQAIPEKKKPQETKPAAEVLEPQFLPPKQIMLKPKVADTLVPATPQKAPETPKADSLEVEEVTPETSTAPEADSLKTDAPPPGTDSLKTSGEQGF